MLWSFARGVNRETDGCECIAIGQQGQNSSLARVSDPRPAQARVLNTSNDRIPPVRHEHNALRGGVCVCVCVDDGRFDWILVLGEAVHLLHIE